MRKDRSHWTVRVMRLGEEPEIDPDVLKLTPAERLDLVEQLSRQAWAWAADGAADARPRLQRHVVRVYRRGG